MEPPKFVENLHSIDVNNLRFGKINTFFDEASNETQEVTGRAVDWFESQGVEIIEVGIPNLPELVAASRLIAFEFREDLNQYLEMFGSEEIVSLQAIVELGLYHNKVQERLTQTLRFEHAESEYFLAVKARETLMEALQALFEDNDLDALIYPTTAQTPVFIGEEQPGNNCSMAAHSGMPAISFPAGFTKEGLPVGIELLGKKFEDPRLLAMVRPFEEANEYRRAPAATPALIGGFAPDAEVREVVFNQSGIRLAADSAEGDYFMSEEFRSAFHNDRIYLKIFGDMFPASGESILLE